MLDGLGAYSSANTSRLTQFFSRLDTNNDGKINRSEFTAGAPKGTSSAQAGQLFDTLNTSNSASLSASDLASAFQQMGSQMQAAMVQAQSVDTSGANSRQSFDPGQVLDQLLASGQSGSTSSSSSSSTASTTDPGQLLDQLLASLQSIAQSGNGSGQASSTQGPPDPSKLFAQLDTNGDGTVNRSEFVAGRPQGMSADQAGGLYDKIANGSTSGLTESQFASGLQNAGDPSSPSASASSSSSTASTTDPGQLLDQLLASLQSNENATAQAGSSNPGQMLDQFLRAISSYENTMAQNAGSTIASTSSVAA